MKMPFFPGCALKTTAKNYELSALASVKKLGIELIELPKWNCCGTVHSLTTDDLMHQIAALRDLIRMQQIKGKGLVDDERLVTLCPCCFSSLKRTNLFLKKFPEKLKKINLAMERDEEDPYRGGVEVIHLLEVLKEMGFDKVEEKVRKPLRGLKVVPFYGCLTLRPKNIGIDHSENPTIFEELLRTLGVEIVEYPYKLKCCGSYLTVNNKYMVAELTYIKLKYALMAGAEAMVITCPLCAFNLDDRQKEVAELHSDAKRMPIFYFTQLMAVAFELTEQYWGFDLNYVNPIPLLKEKNLL